MNSKYLDEKGISYLWNRISLQDYPNNETLITVINAIDTNKADKIELNKYLLIEDYVASESGNSINLSNYLSKNEAEIILKDYLTTQKATNLYAPINIMEQVYPIGAIYLSVNNIEPELLFGFGTWEKIEDRFLLAAGPNFPAGSEGGEIEHTLTELEMPAHDHEFDRHQLYRNESIPPSTTIDMEGYGANNKTLPIYTDTTIATGAGEAHNNMPPYLSIYMWQRIA